MTSFAWTSLLVGLALAVSYGSGQPNGDTPGSVLSNALKPALGRRSDEWAAHKAKFGGLRSGLDELSRKALFDKQYDAVRTHNEEAAQGNHTWYMGLNKFSSWTEAEKRDLTPVIRNLTTVESRDEGSAATYQTPAAYRWWTSEGKVTSVKDQGNCGSCWTFGAQAALESALLIYKGGYAQDLSEQMILDCNTFSDRKCTTGYNAGYAYEYMKRQGYHTEAQRPYKDTIQSCPNIAHGPLLSNYGTISGEANIRSHVGVYGPVVSYVDVSNLGSYTSGVWNSASCWNTDGKLNHAVTIVGYGYYYGKNVWYVKNSWGTGWGESGYFYIERGYNKCGIELTAHYPIL